MYSNLSGRDRISRLEPTRLLLPDCISAAGDCIWLEGRASRHVEIASGRGHILALCPMRLERARARGALPLPILYPPTLSYSPPLLPLLVPPTK